MEAPLQRLGYYVLEQVRDDQGYFKQLSAKKQEEELYFQLERLEEAYVGTFACFVKIIGNSHIDIQFTLKPRSTTYFSAIKEKGILDDYFIISDYDQDQIVDFLNNERIFPIIVNLLQSTIDRELNIASKNGRFLIRIKTDCDYTKALGFIPALETLVWIFQLQKSFAQLVVEIGTYTCQSCQAHLSTSIKICPNCDSITPKCVICLKEPDLSKGVVQLSCCQSYAHEKELKLWFNLKTTCPYCLSGQYEIRKIE